MLSLNRPKKRFGQNFLHDKTIICQIINAIAPQTDQHLLEIGPGHGELTTLLIDRVQQLDAVEIDRDLIANLMHLSARKPNFRLHNADMLHFDITTLNVPAGTLRVFGNLPYNISTPLIFYLLKNKVLIYDLHIMLQAELADRIIAQPGCHEYGRLTVMMQYHCQAEKLFMIPPAAFNPVPQVNSAFVYLKPYTILPVLAQNYRLFTDIVRLAFSQRRKMLRNTLKTCLNEHALLALEISPLARAEELSVKDYVKIANYISNKGSEYLL